MTTQISIAEVQRRALAVGLASTLQAISLAKVNVEATLPPLSGMFAVSAELDFEVTAGEQHVTVASDYVLSAHSELGQTAWTANVRLLGVWDLAPGSSFEPIDYSCFALSIGVMTIHPFARETIHNLTTRTGYPAMALDMLVSPVAGPPDTMIEIDGEVRAANPDDR